MNCKPLAKLNFLAALSMFCLCLLNLVTTAQEDHDNDNLDAETKQALATVEDLFDSGNDANVQQATAMVAAWVERNTLTSLHDDQLAWLCEAHAWSPIETDGGFSVTWTGTITPPASGSYVFSVSPINFSHETADISYWQWMTVTVGNHKVVDADPKSWMFRGQALALTAGAQLPIQVTYRYKLTKKTPIAAKSPAALLFWEGPGIERSIVPADVLRAPDGSASGLLATYHRMDGDKIGMVIATVFEPRVEHFWRGRNNFISPHANIQQRVIDELWRRVTGPGYFAGVEALPEEQPAGGDLEPVTLCANLSSYLTSAQRRTLLEVIAARPVLLQRISVDEATNLYIQLRHGAEMEASAFLGKWMQAHPNCEPKLAADVAELYNVNRNAFRGLTVPLVWQEPRGTDWLEDEYLALSDGSCSLSAAYTLAYAYLVQGKIEQWIQRLESKLADPGLVEDRRVNWLIARAMAEEIRQCPSNRRFLGTERLTAGLEYLDEAGLVATDPETKLRIQAERLARLTAMHRWEEAEIEAQHAPEEWQTRIIQIKNQVSAKGRQRAVKSQQDYLAELQKREQLATEKGDSAAAARFAELINQVQQGISTTDE